LEALQLRRNTLASILKELQLTELSLVDRPANPLAKAPIFKSDSKKGELSKMTDEMMMKLKPYMDKGMSEEEAMKAYEADMKKMADDFEKAKVENERLRKALLDEGYVIKADAIEKKAEPAKEEFIEVDGEQIAKSAIPAPVLKRLEEAEIEKAEAAAVAKAKETLPNVKEGVAVKLVKADLMDDEELLEFLRAVDSMFEKAMGENGETDVDADMGSAEEKLNKMAEDYAAEHKMNFYKAYEAVVKTDDGKALLKPMKKKED
jgi:hypothetical protein